jgi:hypothetical protein
MDPPDLGVPAGWVDEDDEDDPALDPDADEVFDEELPHALTSAAIENKQAAIAASLRTRMASLIPGSPPRAAYSPRCHQPEASTRGAARRRC